MRVYLTSCELGPGAWTQHERALERCWEMSDGRHALVDEPALADIVLIGNARETNYGESIRRNEILSTYPDKCFSLSDQDHPVILNRGIYASGRKSWFHFGRVRTGSYTLIPEDYKNPYIEAHPYTRGHEQEKTYLFSFIGRNCHPVRGRLIDQTYKRSDILIEDSSSFDLWWDRDADKRRERQYYFYRTLLESKFALCPRGNGLSSYRLFEAMKLGVAPVIISDDWILPRGPVWPSFSIIIKEREVGAVEDIVASYESDYAEMGRLAHSSYEEYFSERAYFNYVVQNCLEIKQNQPLPESFFWKLRGLIVCMLRLRASLRVRSRLEAILRRVVRSSYG